jgi:hypothetical protein
MPPLQISQEGVTPLQGAQHDTVMSEYGTYLEFLIFSTENSLWLVFY